MLEVRHHAFFLEFFDVIVNQRLSSVKMLAVLAQSSCRPVGGFLDPTNGKAHGFTSARHSSNN